jgi:N-acetylmuramoyl-L-alanine amidase
MLLTQKYPLPIMLLIVINNTINWKLIVKISKARFIRKEERFMSMINLFLQKRKMHESNHGVVMIVTAYVLSVMMLVMGSDIFYNINTAAAGLNMDTKEETQEIGTEQISKQIPEEITGLPNTDLISPILQTKSIIPFALSEISGTGLSKVPSQDAVLSGDTIWLLGNAMSYEEYDSVMEQMSITDKTSNLSTEETKEAESSTFMAVTEAEVDMLERIVEAEATGEDMKGKILIANVVFNRMADEEFPDTIKGVIFQKVKGDYQFSPVTDERYWSVNVTDTTKEAVKRALQGEDYSKGALYFIARKRTDSSSAKWFDQHLDWLFKHGGHEFYKNK